MFWDQLLFFFFSCAILFGIKSWIFFLSPFVFYMLVFVEPSWGWERYSIILVVYVCNVYGGSWICDPVVMTFCSNESLILVEFLSYPGELCCCMCLVAQVLCSCLVFLAFICLLLLVVFLIVSMSVIVPTLISTNSMFICLVFALVFLWVKHWLFIFRFQSLITFEYVSDDIIDIKFQTFCVVQQVD